MCKDTIEQTSRRWRAVNFDSSARPTHGAVTHGATPPTRIDATPRPSSGFTIFVTNVSSSKSVGGTRKWFNPSATLKMSAEAQ